MKVIISKDKKGKVVYKYKSENGLIFNYNKSENGLVFDYKNHCECYERKWMPERYRKDTISPRILKK